jgi:ppGpp synthetase/RelA/SpoT-type nucleotidyltranferase
MAKLQQPWPDVSDKVSIEQVYEKAQGRAHELLPRFKALLERYTPSDSKLLVNIKSLSSFIRKSNRKPVQKIHDVLRAAILTQTKKEAAKVANEIKRKLPIVEFDKKDDPEETETGYHGSYHLKMRIEDLITEVQIMPETLWVYKEQNHRIYTDTELQQDKTVLTFSRWLYKTANKESG